MSNLEGNLLQNTLYEKILIKYKNLKTEKEDLCQDFSKLQKEYESFKIKEQTKFSELQKENTKLNKIIHDLKSENKGYSVKLTLRDQEIKDLNCRFETKLNIEEKNKERDINLFSKFMGRKPIITNSQDSKFLTIISTYENQKEKLEKKVKDLEKDLISNAKIINTATNLPSQEDFHSKNSKGIQKNLLEKIDQIQREKNILEDDYQEINENYNKMKIEFDKLTMKQDDLSKLVDKFKSQNSVLQQKLSLTQQNFENKENISQNAYFYSNRNSNNESETFTKKEENSNEINLLQKICEIFSVNDYKNLLDSILKTEKVMKAVPKLEQMIMDICNIVLPKVGLEVSQTNIDKLIPTLKQWSSHQDLFVEIVNFKNNLIEKLELEAHQATEIDIYQAIDNLKVFVIESNEEKNNLLNNFNQKQDSSKNMLMMYKMFEVDNEEGLISKISYIFSQFQDFKHFINIAQKLLNLDENMKNETCLTHMLKVLERIKMNKKEDIDFLMKLESEFKTIDNDYILKKIKSTIKT